LSSEHPYYRRQRPAPQVAGDYESDGRSVDLRKAQLGPSGELEDPAGRLSQAQALFDKRAAAAVRAAAAIDGFGGQRPAGAPRSDTGPDGPVTMFPRDALTWTSILIDPTTGKQWVPGQKPRASKGGGIVTPVEKIVVVPGPTSAENKHLLEFYSFGTGDASGDQPVARERYVPRWKCLAAMAYLDYFPAADELGRFLRAMVSEAVLAAEPSWCGTYGPGIESPLVTNPEGNYEFRQMCLVSVVYRYYAHLSPASRDHLILELLGNGRINRPHIGEDPTAGGSPNDWRRAGFAELSDLPDQVPDGWQAALGILLDPLEFLVDTTPAGDTKIGDAGETENHILGIATARYLTNQLLYQRTPDVQYDNRRNGDADEGRPHCLDVVLDVLRNFLLDDFSEYNAKDYQEETRWALLNLCSYAYDHEVRLAARMVLDYVSAHFAVSTNDLRRMVPFRRRAEDRHIAHALPGDFMTVDLLYTSDFDNAWEDGPVERHALSLGGGDPLSPYFAMQAGNTRAYEAAGGRIQGANAEPVLEVLSDYRLPAAIQDLFVNDGHRRYFQRLTRTNQDPDTAGIPIRILAYNEASDAVENMEIYAGSASYLITAGGTDDSFAIDPGVLATISPDTVRQQLGVAVTTSFIPTTRLLRQRESGVYESNAYDVIQFGKFSILDSPPADAHGGAGINYGVAPDFACGHATYLPAWVTDAARAKPWVPAQVEGSRGIYWRGGDDGVPVRLDALPGVMFVDMTPGDLVQNETGPGFYLAIYQRWEGGPGLLEACDTWLHPDVTFDAFCRQVLQNNPNLQAVFAPDNLHEFFYRTRAGNTLNLAVYPYDLPPGTQANFWSANVAILEYGAEERPSPVGGATDAGERSDKMFLNGTVLQSERGSAVVAITNAFTSERIVLDLSDKNRPRRTYEGPAGKEFETAGGNQDVWLDFDWPDPDTSEGDVCQPFNTLGAAMAAVEDGGTIHIVPGVTTDRGYIGGRKRMRLEAPIGGVAIGGVAQPVTDPDDFTSYDVWVDFTWTTGHDVLPWAQSPNPGEARRPLNTLAAAIAATPDNGTMVILPGTSHERVKIGGKRLRISAPLGRVTIG
jgi:hypothetical protein